MEICKNVSSLGRLKIHEGIPSNLLDQVIKILDEKIEDSEKAKKLHKINTCFMYKGMIAQLIQRSETFVQHHLIGTFLTPELAGDAYVEARNEIRKNKPNDSFTFKKNIKC